MATRIILLFTTISSLLILPILSFSSPVTTFDWNHSRAYIQYRRSPDNRYRPSLVSFLHRQPAGSRLATLRYYRIVFHCNILPGSLFLRFSTSKPYRTVVQNRQDPSTIFGFRSVGAYSRIQIQNHISGQWLCMNKRGKIVLKVNITISDLSCTFRQSSDGPYVTLISEIDPSRQMTYSTLYLLSMNPILRRRYAEFMTDDNQIFQPEQCGRFTLDSQIDNSLLNRTETSLIRFRH